MPLREITITEIEYFEKIASLLKQRLEGEILTPDQVKEIDTWKNRYPGNDQLSDRLNDPLRLREMLRNWRMVDKSKAANMQVLLQRINAVETDQRIHPFHRVHFLKTKWFRYAAAVLILFGIGAYLWNTQQKEKPLITTTKPVPVKNDVAPGSTKATLTLSDGRKVELSPETGAIAETGVNIENANGILEYAKIPRPSGTPFSKGGKSEKVVFNTMTTPRGGQYRLLLSDGTSVWLNAASSITYPTAFVSKTREVSITGEAYFEVKRNPAKPFIVNTPEEDITVLGTHFNVNTYPDEEAMKTSLLEGSVKVAKKILKPGEAFSNGKVIKTNIEQDVAWKNGFFNFHKVPLHQVMRQLARWYDLTVIYENAGRDIIVGGEMGRDLNLSQVLTILSDMQVRYRLEGKKLIIL